LQFTVIGQRIYSIGGNPYAARLSGINVNAWVVLALVFSGFCSGIASLIYSSYLASGDPAQGIGYEFSAIATAVLGGTTLEGGRGSIYGTMYAAFVIGLLSNVLELAGVKIFYQNVILGSIIILAVAPTYLRKKDV
jgi:ribose transport system permease protein